MATKKAKTKQKNPKKNTTNKDNSKKILFVVLVALFGLSGGWLLAQSRATKPVTYNTSPNTVVAEVRAESPVIKVQENSPIIPAMQMRLYGNGDLVCGMTDGTYKYASLPAGETKAVLQRLADTNITNTKAVISNDENLNIGTVTSVTLNVNGKNGRNEYRDGAKPVEYSKVDSVVKSTCARAKLEVPAARQFEPAPSNEASEPATEKNEGISAIIDLLAPKASAAAIYSLQNDMYGLSADTNNARKNRGLPALTYRKCLQATAMEQAKRMATNNVLYHNPNLAANVKYDCGGFKWVGENVGYIGGCDWQGYDVCAQKLYEAFMASPGHKANILDTDYDSHAIGFMRTSNGYLWYAHVFADRTTSSKYDAGVPWVYATIGESSLAAGATVKPGQLITMRAGYDNHTTRAGTVATSTEAIYVHGSVPAGTTFVSASNAYNTYLTTGGRFMSTGAAHEDYDNTKNVVKWSFSKVNPEGGSYYKWSTTYTVRVNSGVANGTNLCFHADFNAPGQSQHATGRLCHKVVY